MADEPTNITGQILNEMREEIRQGFAGLRQEIADIKAEVQHIPAMRGDLASLKKSVEDLNVSVATLTVGNRHIRADVSQLLAESGDLESRVARIEQHLGLSKS